jgi:hypothetical protein
MNPAELLEGYYTLDTQRGMEQPVHLQELREQQRAAERAATAVTE